MLACIACSKDEGKGEDTARAGTPSTKSLTSQIKDMVLKFSGLQCKGGATSSSYRYKSRFQRSRSYHDDVASDGESQYGYLKAGSSSSTPAWDFSSFNIDTTVGKSRLGSNNAALVAEESNGEPKEWTALVEPGVQITFVSIPDGVGNDLKRIRFSREMFSKWQAQRWWGENFDRIMELYNVQKFSRQALPTPPRSEDGERELFYSRVGSTRESPVAPSYGRDRIMYRNNNNTNNNNGSGGYMYRAPSTSSSRTGGYYPSVPDPTEHILPHHLFHHSIAAVATGMRVENGNHNNNNLLIDASRTTSSSRDEAGSISVSNASDLEVSEWVEQDEPGVYITIRELPDGSRELRRVRFSRERFGEVHAKLWWEDNRDRIQAQYL